MPHGELSATPAALCPAEGERRTGPPPPFSAAGTPRRTVSDVVTPARDKTTRGSSERIAVECERHRGGVPRCTVAVAALSPSRPASRQRSAPLTMGECWLCHAGSRACEAAALGWVIANNIPDSSLPQPGQPTAARGQHWYEEHLFRRV
ncbi:hypothetical protein TcBrA4_0117920 [Trypanosoma cruzi]|nr:hypothetical protein TcBrA4_0117920 [Trypanosoma cruzi]